MTEQNTEDFFILGKIVNKQGLRGDVRILPDTDDIGQFSEIKRLWIGSDIKGSKPVEYNIERVRYHRNLVIVKFKGVDDANAAEAMRDKIVCLAHDEKPPLSVDEYYFKDLVGMDVETTDGEHLGKITDITRTGANDVYTVGDGLMIPAIKQCIKSVDVAQRRMIVELLEGLREL